MYGKVAFVRVTSDTKESLKQVAKQRGVPISEIIRRAIAMYLKTEVRNGTT